MGLEHTALVCVDEKKLNSLEPGRPQRGKRTQTGKQVQKIYYLHTLHSVLMRSLYLKNWRRLKKLKAR